MAGTLTVSYNHGGCRKKKEARIFKRAMETERRGGEVTETQNLYSMIYDHTS